MKFLTSLDLQKNELQNARIQQLAAAPASPVKGQIYFDTTVNRFYTYDGTSWIDLTAARGGILDAVTLTGIPKVKTNATKAAGSGSTEAFRIESSDAQPLFQVMQNGNTVIAGILTVNGTGTSTFAGDVSIAGKLTVNQSSTVTGTMSGNDLTLAGNLVVQGNTTLGDDASADTVTIKGVTKISSKANKASGSSTTEAFRVESLDAQPLFQVMENGDAKIAGVLTVSSVAGSGSSTFSGTTNAQDLNVSGNLTVGGNTTLGDNASTDTTTVNGYTTINGKIDKASGSATVPVFQVKSGGATPTALFQVMENGNAVIGGVLSVNGTGSSTFSGDVSLGGKLTVSSSATATAALSGAAFSVTGDFSVTGNTTLGDAPGSDTVTMNAKTIVKGALGFGSGSSTVALFAVQDSAAVNLLEVRGNGDFYAAGSIVVKKAATVVADFTGNLMTVTGDMSVTGNTTIGDASTDTLTVNATPTFNTNITMNNKTITGLAAPVNANDAATKGYVDGIRAGLDVKDSVKVATTANLAVTATTTTLTATANAALVIDGVTLATNDRVLVKNQTTASQNGIYIVTNTGSATTAFVLTRSSDADNSTDVTPGMFTFVEQGSTYADTGFVLNTDGAITIGTTSLTFTQFSGAGSLTAGNGLTQTGTTFDVVGTANRITVAADSIDIASTYVGQTSITTLGTITTGTWNGTTIAVANGGTGATTATAARTNLGATGKYAANIGDGTSTVITVTHNLNTTDVVIQVKEVSTNQFVYCDVATTGVNTATVTFATAPASGAYRVIVVG